MSTSVQSSCGPNVAPLAKNIRVYNTLTKHKEHFEPVQPGKVGIYLCGPTVYKESHIGHMVGPVIFDTIKRYLVYSGYNVTWLVNITDVDDKLIAQSRERGLPMAQIAEEMTQDYLSNLATLGVDQIDQLPRATENMGEIILFIEQLIEKGFAYASGGDVFFDVLSDPEYGKLTNRSAESQQGEGGGAADKKHSAADFALWKAAKEDEPFWESPWGKGRPGWHIECSAMSRVAFGETFDIHGGGLDLVFPHHENEIAQSECCHGKPMAKYWLHNGLMRADSASGKLGGRADREEQTEEQAAVQATVDNKISRSTGGGGLADLVARQGGEKIRFFLLRTQYRSTIVFGEAQIAEAATGLETFYRFFERHERVQGRSFHDIQPIASRAEANAADQKPKAAGDTTRAEITRHRENFLAKMDDDFNTGAALSELFDLVHLLNKFADQHNLEDASLRSEQNVAVFQRGAEVLRELSALLGLFGQPAQAASANDAVIGKVVELLLELRGQARGRKDFAAADQLRDALAAAGVVVEDRQGGAGWRIESDDAEVLPPLVEVAIAQRAAARANKDYPLSDLIRDRLAAAGVVLEDRPEGATWRLE